MSSLRLCAPPCWDCASSSSLASRIAIVFSRRWRGESTGQPPGGGAGGHLDRALVRRATDAAGLDLEHGGQRLDRRLELLDGVLAGALADDRQRVIDDLLGRRLLAVEHDLVDDLLDDPRAVDGVRLDRPELGGCA